MTATYIFNFDKYLHDIIKENTISVEYHVDMEIFSKKSVDVSDIDDS